MALKHLLAGIALGALAIGFSSQTATAQGGGDPFLGTIKPMGYNFCPRGWVGADGQLLPINSNQALFSLFGTIYGGDGRTTFAIPDLRGRVPIHMGTGPGLSPRSIGSRGGTETTTMTIAQMPAHTHRGGIQTVRAPADINSPRGNAFSNTGARNIYYDASLPSGNLMASGTLTTRPTGGGQAQTNVQPFQVIRYCVATLGTFPSRS